MNIITSCVDQHSDAHARAVGYMQTGCLCVQAMSSTLVRIEEMGPSGWEDRDTFMAVNRSGKPSVLLCFSSHTLTLSPHILLTHSPHTHSRAVLTLVAFNLSTLTLHVKEHLSSSTCILANALYAFPPVYASTKISHCDPRGPRMQCSLARLIARAHALDHPL